MAEHPEQHHEGDKESGLEAEVKNKDSRGFISKAFKCGFMATASVGSTMLAMATTGLAGPVISAGLASGVFIGSMLKKGKSFYDTAIDTMKSYAALNTVLYPVIALGNMTYPIVADIGAKVAGSVGSIVAKSAYALTAYNAAFIASYRAAEHMLSHYLNPIGMVESVIQDFGRAYKRITLAFSPGLLLTANSITDIALGPYKLPIFALNTIPFGVYTALNPLEEKKPEKKEAAQQKQALAPAVAH